MGPELRSGERSRTHLDNGCKKAVHRTFALQQIMSNLVDERNYGRNTYRIKEEIGTTGSKLLGGTRAALLGAPKTHLDNNPPIKLP